MWIAHFASGLIAKPFAPRVPLLVLCLAGALPDITFFILQLVGIETFNFDAGVAKRGCFPYTNDYPYSHSLTGMAVLGVILAVLYKVFARVPASPKDMIVIVAVSASHFLLEWPSHREDVKITPRDSNWLGAGLFDHPTATFIVENLIFFLGMWVYIKFTPTASQAGYRRSPDILKVISAIMGMQQAHFCFGAAPTYETRWVHGPLFLSELLADCWLIGMLDGQTSSLGIQTPAMLKKEK